MKSDTVKIAQASKKKKTTTFLYSTTQEAETMKGKKHEKKIQGEHFSFNRTSQILSILRCRRMLYAMQNIACCL